jgi:PmbA protein
MTQTLVDLASDAVARAMRLGATAADALVVDARSIEAAVREGKREKLEQSESREVGLRVFVGQASAVIAGSVLTPDALDRLAEKAVAMAKLAPADEYAGLANGEILARGTADLDLVSEQSFDADQLHQLALAAEAASLSVPGVTKAGGAGASASDREVAMANSNGFAKGYRRTSFSVSASAIAGDGTRMERDYDFSATVHRGDLENAEKIGRSAGERVVKRLNPRKIKSQQVPIIYDSRIAPGLVGHLVGAVLGSAIARGTSFLKDMLRQQVFAPGINVIDDPTIRRGLASRPFDGEGIAGKTLKIVDNGVLATWLLDLRSARQLGLKSTAHASRGLSSPPSPSSSNVYMERGKSSPQELMSDIKQGLYVTELIGMGVNMVTGDYSRGAAGFWIENGEIAYPVSEITVAGNLKDMFRNLTPANDLKFKTSTNAPTIRVEGLTVAGA